VTKTRDSYLLSARSVPELVRELNFTFQRIADRLDKIEGIRGSASIDNDLSLQGGPLYVYDTDGNLIHSISTE
jgi:hypothetical protein